MTDPKFGKSRISAAAEDRAGSAERPSMSVPGASTKAARNSARTAKPRSPPKPKLKRADKAEVNRKALIHAAAKVIGEYGYSGASIARITERAGLAQGTFYLYFESQQALFDILLPEIAMDALAHLTPLVHGSADLLDLEERGLRGVLQWEEKNPGLARLRSEAEVAAPLAFNEYLEEILSRYIPALRRGQLQGYLKGYEDKELTVVAYMLMGARHYLRYSFGKHGKPPKWAIDAYMRFVKGGLLSFAEPAGSNSSSTGGNRGKGARKARSPDKRE